MLFNSLEFIIFLPIVFCLYWFAFNKSCRTQNFLILVASYFFYGWWSWKFLGLLALSTFLDFNYGFGVASVNRKRAKIFLWLGIINNIGILAVFKYYNFFVSQFQRLFDSFGLHTDIPFLNIILPIGISFYTFHGLSYVFDIYNGKQKPVSNFIDYAVFVGFFPLLVAGPIERAGHLLPQVQKKRVFSYTQAVEGCRLILWGMFKKVVIADSISSTIDAVYQNYKVENAYVLIIAAIGFSFQIYADFSGYSDIAIGSAKLLGFELLSNFKFPFFSHNITEFWRRWHISLSTWFQDYLFTPLLIKLRGLGKWSVVIALLITFFIIGLWHGAAWTFVVFGCLHGLVLIYEILSRKMRKKWSMTIPSIIYNPLSILLTFAFNVFAWVFFRLNGMNEVVGYFSRIIVSIFKNPGQFMLLPNEVNIFAYIIPFIVVDWWLRSDERKLKMVRSFIRYPIYIVMLYIIIERFGGETAFIYFQF